MKQLKDLLEKLEYEGEIGDGTRPVAALVSDSRKLCRDCLFVAIKGENFDGHSAIKAAAENGAAAVLAQYADEETRECLKKSGTALLVTEDTRRALALCSAAWFDYPAEKLCMIGITGTKGKSSSACMIKTALDRLGIPCGLIGSIEIDDGKNHIPSKNTTPESIELQEILSEMVTNGLKAVVMEVSSQGLKMHRTDGILFDVGVFTNLSPDHIGPREHEDFADYLHCKSLLFRQCVTACVNADDPHTEEVLAGNSCKKIVRFGFSENADRRAEAIELAIQGGHPGVAFSAEGFGKAERYWFPFPGRFSASNILAAMSALEAASERLGFSFSAREAAEAITHTMIKGRIELLPVSEEYSMMIDYAHNAMALESLLKTLREYGKGRLVTLFGCGGDRARSRRFEMGEASGRLSDLSIVTSDNPRSEDPMAIIEDILSTMKKTGGEYVTIPDRKEAIEYAIAHALPGDIIILAGKGHEDYQEIAGVKHHMDERELVYDILRKRGDQKAAERMLARYPELGALA
ncbi:MAG: UDP-N-acetylmuramoyl-L-alanyl-D-glutamate--2,6-diaminopimelate ligase [Lachnospiraceae bacterium]|nr:UDP-N-acetylmuramoyl-L-alanyl-D-glutamate--2,6-diaminopimelate ligase [Lachnospiraceae bacterium]